MLSPVNKIPPEILSLIPDFWNTHERNQNLVALTHACRAWRELFISRSSLWTYFDFVDEEKTQVYLERSKSSPVNLSLDLSEVTPLCDPFFQVIPHITGRLRSLFILGPLEDVEVVTRVISHLSHPAPLLEHLSIRAGGESVPDHYPTLPSTLFNGDLPSLRTLYLESIHTELPWRNMVNLTSFILSYIPIGAVSVGQLLDFVESAPHLEEVKLYSATPTAGAQNGRVVPLACLKSMCIEDDDHAPSVLLDHLLIPTGAKLEIQADLVSSLIGVHLPRSLDNLKNFSDFTAIKLCHDIYFPHMEFSGPNGQVNIAITTSRSDLVDLTLGSLAELDTSKTKRLRIDGGYLLSWDPLYRALLPMKDLRTLTLSGCPNPGIFIRALQPATSSSEVVVCPKLEELVLVLHPHDMMSHLMSVVEMAAARASRGKKLRTFRIVGGRDTANVDVLELRKHVWNVEYSPRD